MAIEKEVVNLKMGYLVLEMIKSYDLKDIVI